MTNLLNKYFSGRYLPRWVVLFVDSTVVGFSFLLAYALRHNFLLTTVAANDMYHQMPMMMVCYWISFFIFKPYSGVLRFTVTQDIFLIFYSVIVGSGLFFAFDNLTHYLLPGSEKVVSQSVLIIHTVVAAYLMVVSRLGAKFLHNIMNHHTQQAINVMIYGAGELGQATLVALRKSENPSFNPVGFIDTNNQLKGLKRNGLTIFSTEEATSKIIKQKGVKEVIIAISPERLQQLQTQELIDYCIFMNIIVKKVPPVHSWIDGSFSPRLTKNIDITDLLGRDEIQLDCMNIQAGLNEKTIMITGAAGSIGSEIVRQLMTFRPGKLVLVDQAESALYDLQMELVRKYNGSRKYEMVLADVTNYSRMDFIFRKYRPNIIFNASAYKHVPLLEDNVCEAVRVNIGGTKLLADLAVRYGVEKFVMISTDKAVNPTNVMGASKRICELYVQSLTTINGHMTSFITTRFGNVLGSNGSVVPLFTKQIEEGGPVTVTHKDIERFFMTIPEACQLVLEAGFMGKGGEIFVFDMGKPVRIYDLARKMITLAGFVPGKDIQIVETGLRPGEKLFEEVLASKEKTQPTHNPKILIANHRKTDPYFVKRRIDELLAFSMKEKENELVRRIKILVPEFMPQNQKYADAVRGIIFEADNTIVIEEVPAIMENYVSINAVHVDK
jgi:FlaA1/EpsC-like NDP-sugar epimerase